ncbi:MAG: hypothetical protein LBG95_07885 [Treponema sp.]|nr:hypothetical protein [Treponema sp.]
MKIVMRSLILMLSLMMGLMVLGCDDNPDEEDTRVVEKKYWGDWIDWDTGWIQGTQGCRIRLTEKEFYYINFGRSFSAYTDKTDLYVKGDFTPNDTNFRKVGTFQDDTTLIFADFDHSIYTCIKQD